MCNTGCTSTYYGAHYLWRNHIVDGLFAISPPLGSLSSSGCGSTTTVHPHLGACSCSGQIASSQGILRRLIFLIAWHKQMLLSGAGHLGSSQAACCKCTCCVWRCKTSFCLSCLLCKICTEQKGASCVAGPWGATERAIRSCA